MVIGPAPPALKPVVVLAMAPRVKVLPASSLVISVPPLIVKVPPLMMFGPLMFDSAPRVPLMPTLFNVIGWLIVTPVALLMSTLAPAVALVMAPEPIWFELEIWIAPAVIVVPLVGAPVAAVVNARVPFSILFKTLA